MMRYNNTLYSQVVEKPPQEGSCKDFETAHTQISSVFPPIGTVGEKEKEEKPKDDPLEDKIAISLPISPDNDGQTPVKKNAH
jgi:hypothetical protein